MICVGEGSAALDPHVCLTTCLHNSTAPRAWHTRSMCALSLCHPTRAIAVPQRAASKLRVRARVQRGVRRPVMRAAEDSACRH